MTRSVLLIDGGSGSGKTSLAHQIAAAVGDAVVVSLDDFYPGWSGLAAGSRMVVEDVLGRGGFRRWDWDAGRPGEWVAVPPAGVWIIEGCGALTPGSRALTDAALWLEADAGVRKARALARDGGAFDPWWDHWAAQEAEHWARHEPWRLADVVVRR